MRKKWSDSEKARIALMALREEKTISKIAQETGAHPNMISKWKRELIDNADSAFWNGKSEKENELEEDKEELWKQHIFYGYRQIYVNNGEKVPLFNGLKVPLLGKIKQDEGDGN